MNPSDDNIMEVRHLTVAFASKHGLCPVVDDVSFDIPQGKCVGIVGESGCGKSVTAMSLVRLLPQPAAHVLAGSITYRGEEVLTMREKRLRELRGGHIGAIFQEPMQALNPVQRIGDQIAETLILHQGLSADAAWKEAVNLLDFVRIAAPRERANDYPHELSGGMRQRVMIAIALACRPELIIADEPTTALDVTVQHQILALLRELRRELGAASLLITHDLGVIAQHCDIVWVMYAGRMIESAPANELFAHPCHAYTKALLSSIPRADYARKTHLPTLPGHIASPHEYVQGCRFCQRLGQPEHLLSERPSFVPIGNSHYVEACPRCTGRDFDAARRYHNAV